MLLNVWTYFLRRLVNSAVPRTSRRLLTRRQSGIAGSCEQLEVRTMLSAELPGITVGRTLSTYDTAGIQANQVAITYTVYNDQGHDVTGVLLTDTLQSGVTFSSATDLPNRNGQDLAWSLGTIPAFSRTSVTLIVSVNNPATRQLDAGAHAFAILDAGTVSDSAPAATLRSGSIDPALLASTMDANTNDPFIQAQAAQLDYDSQRIFDFLQDEIAYHSYIGSVRGSRGTLWSGAGNSLDVASLGVALMRASGIPAQYMHGVLSDSLAQQMIVSMFPEQFRSVGVIPPGAITGDPANSPQLLVETRDHYWMQFDTGTGFRDADPLIAGAVINQAFTTPTSQFSEVPDALREKTTVTVNAEIYRQAAGKLGLGDGLSQSTVLTHTFRDVELVGHPLTIGTFVDSNTIGAVTFAVKTTTYSPYFALGDVAFDSTSDQITTGQDFQEILTNFPLGNQILTGVFLEITQSGSGGQPETYYRTLFDRIGYAPRQGLVNANVSVDPNGPPALSSYDVFTLNILASTNSSTPFGQLSAQIDREVQALPGDQATPEEVLTAEPVVRDLNIAVTRLAGNQYLSQTDVHTQLTAAAAGVLAYYDRPRIVLTGSRLTTDLVTNTSRIAYWIDLVREEMRTVTPPGQPTEPARLFNTVRGIYNNVTERNVIAGLGAGNVPIQNTIDIFQAAVAQGIGFTTITRETLFNLEALDISLEAKARITTDVLDGYLVVVPNQNVLLNGVETVAWAEIDQETGEFIGVTQDGGHEGLLEFFALLGENVEIQEKLTEDLGGLLTGFFIGAVLGLKYQLLMGITGDPHLAAEVLLEDKSDAIEYVEDLEFGFKFTATLWATVKVLTGQDPPFNPFLSHLNPPTVIPTNLAIGSLATTANVAAGSLTGTVQTPHVMVDGQISGTWTAAALSSFDIQSLAASAATVQDSLGNSIGSGSVTLSVVVPVGAAVSGNNHYAMNGRGSVTVYGSAESTLAVSGDWENYSATVSATSGLVSIAVTTSGLTLNGNLLPAGQYTITVASATLTGNGSTSAPTFSGTAAMNATGGTVIVGPGTGTVSLSGQPSSIATGVTLNGYTGSLAVTSNVGTLDTLTLNGTANNFLSITSTPPGVTTDQNTPATFQLNLLANLPDDYAVTVRAPTGWTVDLSASGLVTVTPAPGLQSGTVPVVVVVQSAANPDLIAQCVVNVTINSTLPGISLAVNLDPIFTVPFDGAEIPSAFQTVIDNLGPAEDTFNLSFSNLSSNAFTILTSADSVTIPAGEMGVRGLYLQPDTTQTLPLPGTTFSFTVTATSATNPLISKSQTVNFIVPQIHSITVSVSPTELNSIPGVGTPTMYTFKNVGNVAENITFSTTASPGLTITNLQTNFSLAIGATRGQSLQFTPAAGTPVNTTLTGKLNFTYGATGARVTQSAAVPLHIVVPGAAGIANAARTADLLGSDALANRLRELSVALGNVIVDQTSDLLRSQALSLIDTVIGYVGADPYLAFLVPSLTTGRNQLANAVTPTEFQTAVNSVGNALVNLSTFLIDILDHSFVARLSPDAGIALPGVPTVYNLFLQNTGTQTTTYQLPVQGLPAGVTGVVKRNGTTITSVTLQPNEIINGGANGITVELTQTSASLVPTTFNVRVQAVGASQIFQDLRATLAVRTAFVGVTQVIATPAFTTAGTPAAISAKVLNAVNAPQSAKAFFTVTDPVNNLIFTSAPVSFDLTVQTSLVTINLGTFPTTGLANGSYLIDVTVTDSSDVPLPGGTGSGTLLIGLPVTGSLTVNPDQLQPGNGTVTNTLTIDTQTAFPDPLTLVGQVQTSPTGTSVALSGNLAYVVGTHDIEVVDVANPATPQVVHTFGQADIVNNGFSVIRKTNIGGVDYLLVGTTVILNSSQFKLLIYSLSDPQHPALVSSTPFAHQVMSEMLISGTTLLVPTYGYVFSNLNGSILDQYGTVVSIDISNPALPVEKDVLFTNPAKPAALGGDTNQLGGAIVNGHFAYIASTTSVGSQTQVGTGRILIVDFADPTNLTVVGQVTIPNSVQAVNIAIEGNRALVVGSTGGWRSPQSATTGGLTGTMTLSVLDISTPTSPTLIGATHVTDLTFAAGVPVNKVAAAAIGSNRFVVSQGISGGSPKLLIVDATTPAHISVSADVVPALNNDLVVSGNQLYTTSSSGLTIYNIGATIASPFTASVQVPNGTGVSIVAGSFSIAPSQIINGVDFNTLVWSQALAYGETTRTITWQSTVTGLDAGEVVPVTLGGTVDFTSEGVPGTIELSPTVVSGLQIVGLSPATQTITPGASATFTVTVYNNTNNTQNYNLLGLGLPTSWFTLQSTVSVPANGSNTVSLTIKSDSFSTLGDHSFAVRAQTGGGITAVVYGNLIVQGTPPAVDLDSHGVVVTLTPSSATAGQGTSAIYTVRVTNTGSTSDTFDLSTVGLPAGIGATFSQNQITVPNGLSNYREIQLTVTADLGTSAGNIPFTVKAIASALAKPVSDTAAGSLVIVPEGVEVSLNPPSGAANDSFQLTITNKGSQTDTFDLTLAGPAAIVAELGARQVTLNPGEAQVVNIAVGPIAFAGAGTLDLTVTATSQSTPTVRKSATANVTLPATEGMNASFTPATKLLQIPGTTSFLLLVNNTGNTGDAYTATITGTSGPVNASLTDLTGRPTQTIPVFRLPGLFSSALLLQTTLTGFGQGAVTVQIRSLNNAERTVTATATVTADAPANDAPTDITLSANTIAENQPAGTVVGSFTTTDPNAGDTFTYSLVSGSGSADNSAFTLSLAGQLAANSALNFESQSTYQIRVRTTDQGGLALEKQFTITVTNIDEPPEIVLTPGIRILPVPVKKIALDPQATIRDVDTPVINLANSTVQIKVIANAAKGDKVRLLKSKQGDLVIKGKNIFYQGTLIGERIYGKKGGVPLTVHFNGSATQAGVEALLDKIYYRTKGTPGSTRTLEYSLSGLSNGQSTRSLKQIELA